MSGAKDFSKMTIEELTPIVSMRPGKEYTKEELQKARAAFMEALATDVSPEDELQKEECTPVSGVTKTELTSTEQLPTQDETIPETKLIDEPDFPTEETNKKAASSVHIENEVFSYIEESENSVTFEAEKDAFILKVRSPLARILYILYAYLFVPLLSLEALSLLIASVATAVVLGDTRHLFVSVLCTTVYTLFVTIAWHQFLYRSRLGLLLNRSLIAVCLFRGISMLFSASYLLGIIFIALSVLYFVFFIGYDNTFIIKPPKQQHER